MFPWFKVLKKNTQNLLSLYVHWPYCKSKCPYCDFNSHINEKIDINKWIASFNNQLCYMKDELIHKNIDFKNLNTIFFGGGTPSLMPIKIIEHILNISDKIFGMSKNIEITLEANPSSSDKNKLINLKKVGINRLSIGVQSLNNKNLKFLGRLHNIKDAQITLENASNLFKNISVDLIYALYGQKLKIWTNELILFLKTNNLHHISLYQLTIEENTQFFNDYKKGLIKLIDNDLAAEFYSTTNDILKEFQFFKYEISNYAKKGFECRHNLNYWNSENWIGIGPGAYGRVWLRNPKVKRIEYKNYTNPKTWLSKNMNKAEFEKIYTLEDEASDIDTLIMGLRLNNGIRISKLKNKLMINSKALEELQNKNIISTKNGILKVNENHSLKLNSIINYLIDV